MPRQRLDLANQRFGKLVVIDMGEPYRSGEMRWNCRCDCGATALVAASRMKNGIARSCGCMRGRRVNKPQRMAPGAHRGSEDHPLCWAWRHMHSRCGDVSCKEYAGYGARGIVVDARWGTYAAFKADMGPSWRKGLSLDRIDNDGPYSPENCRWATQKVQCNNKRNTLYIETPEGRLPVTLAAERFGVSAETLRARVHKGRGAEDLFPKPLPIGH